MEGEICNLSTLYFITKAILVQYGSIQEKKIELIKKDFDSIMLLKPIFNVLQCE